MKLPLRQVSRSCAATLTGESVALEATAQRATVGPNTSSNVPRMHRSTSGIVTGMPRSTRLVTPCRRTPQGTMPEKCAEVRLDVEADAVEGHPAADADADRGDLVLGGLAPCRAVRTQTPTRSSRRSPRTLNAASVAISQASRAAT